MGEETQRKSENSEDVEDSEGLEGRRRRLNFFRCLLFIFFSEFWILLRFGVTIWSSDSESESKDSESSSESK